MDEPATGLDAKSTDSIVDLIGEQKRAGAIVIVVTHEDGFAGRVADQSLFMERGRVVERSA
jgi:ABC-type phosphate transport system ATPase subunit